MYRKPSPQMTIEDFILPFSGKLSADNRWVQLANIIPWDELEKQYAFMFPSDRGNVAKPVRMALGSLIIQARCGFTDRETVQQITENPYLQYFIGLKEYQVTRPFTPAAMVKFRNRFNAKRLVEINERILMAEKAHKSLQKNWPMSMMIVMTIMMRPAPANGKTPRPSKLSKPQKNLPVLQRLRSTLARER